MNVNVKLPAQARPAAGALDCRFLREYLHICFLFASPVKVGRLPYSYTGVWRELRRAAEAAGIGKLGTHAFWHTYRTWLDSIGTPVGVQQRLMRHSDIRTTMNQYGDALTDDMWQAHSKVVDLALSRA